MFFRKWFGNSSEEAKSSPEQQDSSVNVQRDSTPAPPTTTHKPPTKKQIEECQLFGIEVAPHASSREIWALLENAKRAPPTQAVWEEHCRKQREKEYEDLLEEYSDEFSEKIAKEVIGDYRKWTEDSLRRGSCHCIVIFKVGKKIAADVMELESVELEETSGGKPFAALHFLLPKKYKGGAYDSPRLEWEKEFTLKPVQVLEQRWLEKAIDMFDLERYESVLVEAQSLVNTFA